MHLYSYQVIKIYTISNRAHSGEVSFPGGRCDSGETVEETALRETHEELGIKYSDIDIWDKMRPVMDKKGIIHISRTILE